MIKKFVWIVITLLFTSSLQAEVVSKYRVWLKDKSFNRYSIEKPEEFLSKESIARRERQGISIDTSDLPVSEQYIDEIKALGIEVITTSRWLNTVVVAFTDEAQRKDILSLPFVKKVEPVWQKKEKENVSQGYDKLPRPHTYTTTSVTQQRINNSIANQYGDGYHQLSMINIDSLHLMGFKGEGMKIAVLDAGFYNIDKNPTISPQRIRDVRCFTGTPFSYEGDSHGAMVLSCMASNDPYNFIGSAPEADYWLAITEDKNFEYPIEEDYWVAGAEWADSVGVDIINTSLGYNRYDDESMSYLITDLNGRTAFCSRGANMAADKGIIVVVAAGNEGMKLWERITFPGDASDVITVGSVDANGIRSPFSSVGYTSDGRVKPDIMAMGSNTHMVLIEHNVTTSSGTSFATPIIAGGLACLWQGLPQYSASQIKDAILKTSSMYNTPGPSYGYGLPNFYAAFKECSGINKINTDTPTFLIYTGNSNLRLSQPPVTEATLTLYDTGGQIVLQKQFNIHNYDETIPAPTPGLYIAILQQENKQSTQKLHIAQ